MAGATRVAAQSPIVSRLREAVANPATAYLLRAAAWFVGLLGLLRLPWVQTRILLPYTNLQAGVAERLLGEDLQVAVAISCSGSDAMALCLGAILAFPAPWRRRLAAAAGGLAVITVVNTIRLAHLSTVAGNRERLDLFHLQVWPAFIILVAAGYAFAWMRAVTAPRAASEAPGPGGGLELSGLRVWPSVGVAATLVAFYYAFYDQLLASPLLAAAAERTAWIAGGLMGVCGVQATVEGGILRTGSGAWVVTSECVTTPLIPIAAAAVLVARMPWRLRLLALVALPLVFQALAVARLMVLAIPRFLIGSPTIAVHAFYQVLLALALIAWLARRHGDGEGAARRTGLAMAVGGAVALAVGAIDLGLARPFLARLGDGAHLGHGHVDPQGVLVLLPAFQLGLLTALWAASPVNRGRALRVATASVLAIAAGSTVIIVGELSRHAAVELPVVALRAWSLVLPLVLGWRWRRLGGPSEWAAGSARSAPSPAA